MKKKTHLLLIAVAIVSLISSCSMEKRLYLPGYNVEWKKSDISKRNMDFAYENLTTKEQAVENPQLFPANTDELDMDATLTASNDNSLIVSGSIYKQRNVQQSDNIVNAKKEKSTNILRAKFQDDLTVNTTQKAESGGGANGLAVASLILGIAGIIFLFLPSIAFALIALLSSILSIVFGFVALGAIRKNRESSHDDNKQGGKGLAIAGLICGFLGLFIWISVIALVASLY